MRKKNVAVIVLVVTLLVVLMASTAFAGNFNVTSNCEPATNKEVEVDKGNGPKALEEEKLEALETLLTNKPEVPAVEEPEVPAVEEPEVPVEPEAQWKSRRYRRNRRYR
ncbi:MAG: hypothetical protein ACOX42_03270 [Clostridia bacterium]